MRPGFWQILFVVGLVLFFFGGPILRIVRAMKRYSSDASRPPEPPPPKAGKRASARDAVVDAEIVDVEKR